MQWRDKLMEADAVQRRQKEVLDQIQKLQKAEALKRKKEAPNKSMSMSFSTIMFDDFNEDYLDTLSNLDDQFLPLQSPRDEREEGFFTDNRN